MTTGAPRAARFPWFGGDLQTLRYYFFPASEDLFHDRRNATPWYNTVIQAYLERCLRI